MWCDFFRQAGVMARMEVTGLFQQGDRRPADVFVPAGQMEVLGNKDTILDVTITSATSASNVQKGSWRSPLVSALAAEARKESAFKSALSHSNGLWSSAGFVPLAVESSGAFGPQAEQIFHKVCARWAEVNETHRSPGLLGVDFAWSSMSFSSLWKQKFSFVLAKLQAQAIEIAAASVRRGLVDVASV